MMVMMLESSRSFGAYLIAACQDSASPGQSWDPPVNFFDSYKKLLEIQTRSVFLQPPNSAARRCGFGSVPTVS